MRTGGPYVFDLLYIDVDIALHAFCMSKQEKRVNHPSYHKICIMFPREQLCKVVGDYGLYAQYALYSMSPSSSLRQLSIKTENLISNTLPLYMQFT